MKDKRLWNKNSSSANQELLQSIATIVRDLKTGGIDLGSTKPRRRGVLILFSGPSGTGKTMAAELLAKQLGKPLQRIDLSRVISKYIGETEKNLDKLLSDAEIRDAVLFFDEADALFGRRSKVTDAHDRYANLETNYLTAKLESYAGIAILTTSLKAKIDSAFLRRIHKVIRFPRPDTAEE